MISMVQVSLLTLFDISWFGSALTITCPAPTSLLTDASRDKILGTVNRDRELIRRGELLLSNGQYALQGAFMKNLTWDCNVEAKLAETVEAMCNGSHVQYSIFSIPYVAIMSTFGKLDVSINDHVDLWITSDLFNASTYVELKDETKYTTPVTERQFTSFYLSDVGKTIACAAYQCTTRNLNQLICKTSSSVVLNESIYVPGNPDVVTTPAPEPSCQIPESKLLPVHRERIINKMNEKRSKVLNGTLLLNNGKYALQAQEMPMLSWDCDLEAKMYTQIQARCSKPDVTPTRNDSNWYKAEVYNSVDYYVHELSKTNIEALLTFLSNTTNGRVGHLMMDERVLHDKATKVGCAFHQCYFTGVGITRPLTMLMCTFDVNWQIVPAELIYVPRTNISTTTTTTSTTTPITTTTTSTTTTTTTTTPLPPTSNSYDNCTTGSQINPCAVGWVYNCATNFCYRYINASNTRSQAQAEQYCVNQGKKGHLVSIHSQTENGFVKSLFASGGDNVLIGYNNEAWTDATPIDYSNFLTACGNNVCATFSAPSFQWKSVDCNGPFKQFVCKRNV